MANGMTAKERWLRAMEMREVDRPPVCCMTQSATLDQMDAVGVYWPDVHTSGEKMAKLALAGNEVIGFESVRVPYCLTVEAEIMGVEVNLGKKDRTPMVKSHPFNEDTIDEIEIPENMIEKGRAKEVVKAAEILKDEVGDELPVVVGTTGPFTIAGHLVGTENLLLWIVTNPDAVHRVLEKAAEIAYQYHKEIDQVGVDAIQQSEPSASTDMLSGEMFDEFAAPYIKRSLEGVNNAKTVLHICGDTEILIDHMIETGTDGLSIEEKVDPYKAVELVDGRIALIGNIGVVNPLLQGTPEDVVEETKRVVDSGFEIINSGCGLAASVPKENLLAMVRTVQEM